MELDIEMGSSFWILHFYTIFGLLTHGLGRETVAL